MESFRKGDTTEAMVIAELKERNIPVSSPFGDNERYDLLAEVPDGELLRIQVKTGRYKNGTIRFDGWSQHTNASCTRYVSYQGDVDYFIVYCDRFESLYLVDADLVNSSLHLRVDQPAVDHPAINWAQDYEFDRCWPPETTTGREAENADPNLPSHRRGDATEARVIAELLQRGVSIATPSTDNERYDLILSSPAGNLYRVQVKTGWITRGCVTFRAASSHVNAKGVVRKPYGDDVDYFLVYAPAIEEMFLIAGDSVNTTIYLRVDNTKRPDRTANNASEFLFDRVWPPEHPASTTPEGRGPSHGEFWNLVEESFNELHGVITKPVNNEAPYDLLVETANGGIIRCVMRTAQTREGRLFFHPGDHQASEEFDYYLLYGYDTDQLYLIDPSFFDSSITLWVDSPTQVRRTTIRAEDYELEQQWPPSSSSRVRKSMLLSNAVDSFRALGAELAYPATEDRSDLWIKSARNQFLKIAIEPGWVSNGLIRLKPDSKRGIDCFTLVSRELDTCYLVRADEFDASISLRITPPERDDGTVRYAADYELTSRWPLEASRIRTV